MLSTVPKNGSTTVGMNGFHIDCPCLVHLKPMGQIKIVQKIGFSVCDTEKQHTRTNGQSSRQTSKNSNPFELNTPTARRLTPLLLVFRATTLDCFENHRHLCSVILFFQLSSLQLSDLERLEWKKNLIEKHVYYWG